MNHSDEFRSTAPVVARTMEPLWAEIRHPVDGPSMVQCPTQVCWLRRTECQVLFEHGGLTVKSFGTYVDVHGPFSEFESAIALARPIAARYGVGSSSSACVSVALTIEDRPALPVEALLARNTREAAYNWWRPVPNTLRQRQADPHAADRADGATQWIYPTLSSKPVYSGTIWSSSETAPDPHAQALVCSLKQRFFE
jgi:hypothetical protein